MKDVTAPLAAEYSDPPTEVSRSVSPFSWSVIKRRMSKSKEDPAAKPPPCHECNKLRVSVCSLNEDVDVLEEELLAHKELQKILQRQIDIHQRNIQTRELLSTNCDISEYLSTIKQNNEQLVKLEHLLTATYELEELAKDRIRCLENHVIQLEDQITASRESLISKDQTIMSLTNKVFEIERGTPSNSPASDINSQKHVDSSAEIQHLHDLVDAYVNQNKFLNKEIIELSSLRSDDEQREKSIYMEYKKMEAMFCQTESKYLFALQQLNKPTRGGGEGEQQEVVSRLLEEAITNDARYMHSETHQQQFDKYGFRSASLQTADDLMSKAISLQRYSDNLKSQDVEREISFAVKWENLLSGIQRLKDISQCVELKAMIRSGIPTQHKEAVWKMLVNYRVEGQREKLGAGYYQNMIDKAGEMPLIVNPATKQIELDLLRTLPHNRHYQSMECEGTMKLRRVLLAYTYHNPDIGYCQGLNRLAAIALLFLSEEDAFWCMVCILDYILPPEYYDTTLTAAQVDQRVLKDLIVEKLPRLASHLEAQKVDVSLFTFNWFLTIFIDNIPVETYLRIWDTFLFEGTKVLFRFAIAFLKMSEEGILQQDESMHTHKYMRGIAESMTNTETISQVRNLIRMP